MNIIFKTVKQSMPHCGDCGDILLGNGSIILPYRCKCGEWEYKVLDNGYYQYELKK